MQSRPKIFKAILIFVLGLFTFALSYLLAYLLFGGIIYVLLKVPLIGRLIDLLFFFRGDSPDMMLSILCSGIAYLVTMAAQDKLNKETPTKGLSCVILGVFIVIIQAISLILNLIYGEGILTNVVQVITGFVIFSAGIGYIKES